MKDTQLPIVYNTVQLHVTIHLRLICCPTYYNEFGNIKLVHNASIHELCALSCEHVQVHATSLLCLWQLWMSGLKLIVAGPATAAVFFLCLKQHAHYSLWWADSAWLVPPPSGGWSTENAVLLHSQGMYAIVLAIRWVEKTERDFSVVATCTILFMP